MSAVLNNPKDYNFKNIDILAISICETDAQQFHVGFIYVLDNGIPTLCDLAWHHKLRHLENPKEQPGWALSPLYWQNVSLHPLNRNHLAATLEALRPYGDQISYGLKVKPPVFTAEGKYIPQPDGKGMTCATFIIEIYRANSIPLIEEDTWPARDEDKEWQEKIIQKLSEGRAEKTHIDKMKKDTGSPRFRPDEVAGATLQEKIPVKFDDCEKIASEIRVLIEGSK